MTLDDYARLYTFKAASLTMARFVSPRLGWRVRDAANSNCARLASPRAGADRSLSPISPALSQSLDHLLHDKGFTA